MKRGILSIGLLCATALAPGTVADSLATGAQGAATGAQGAATGAQGAATGAQGAATGAQGAELAIGPLAGGRVLDARRVLGFKAEVAHRIFNGGDGGEIALAALAVALPTTGPVTRVRTLVEIDGTTLPSHDAAAAPWLEVYIYAIGAGQQVAAHLADAFQIVSEQGVDSTESGFKLHGQLELAPGAYQLRVLVRHPQGGVDGATTMRLVLPDSAGGQALPLLAEPARWVAVRSTTLAPGEPYPFVFDGRSLSPASRPVIANGREARLHLLTGDLGEQPWDGNVQFLASAGGENAPQEVEDVVAEVRIDSIEARRGEEQALGALAIRFLPPRLAAGEYRLRLQLRDATGRRFTSAPIVVWLLAGDVRDRDVLWTDLRWMIDPPEPAAVEVAAEATTLEALPAGKLEPQAPEPSRAPRRGRQVRRVAARYRNALAEWTGGSIQQVRQAMVEVESEVLGRGAEQLDVLQAAKATVAAELADLRVESLAPLFALHLETYRLYRGRRLHTLVAHTRGFIEQLVDLYADRGGDRRTVADVLTSLGGDLQAADQTASSERLFQRALEHQPGHRGALLGLATGYERQGKPLPAQEALTGLVEAHPDFLEGRLRLAINLDRLGLERRARPLLEEVVAQTGPAWVKALAYQQLARQQIENGALDPAAELLQAAIEVAPAEQTSQVLLAYVQDRQRRPLEALRLLEAVQGRGDNGGSSAAKRYDSWPRSVLQVSRDAVARAAEANLATLAEALAASAQSR
ncbi:MAG: hypothetical protein AAF657_13205 [Acidobacteriota bacterium]